MDTPKNERFDIRLGFELKGASLDENTISGAAAVIGNVDSYGDVIFPGAFSKAVLSEFLSTGFVPDAHDWGAMASLVAMPKSAKVNGRALECTAKFHTTERAQEVRKICMERIENGLAVGLSIGFSIDWNDSEARMWFDDSKAFQKYLKDTGADLSLFDMDSIKAWGGYIRAIFKIKRLFEFSPVPIPANGQANAMSVKQFASDLGSLAGLSLEDHSNSVLAAVRGLAERVASVKSLREADGRSLSAARKSELEELKGLIEGLLTSTDEAPADHGAALRDLQRKALAQRRELASLV